VCQLAQQGLAAITIDSQCAFQASQASQAAPSAYAPLSCAALDPIISRFSTVTTCSDYASVYSDLCSAIGICGTAHSHSPSSGHSHSPHSHSPSSGHSHTPSSGHSHTPHSHAPSPPPSPPPLYDIYAAGATIRNYTRGQLYALCQATQRDLATSTLYRQCAASFYAANVRELASSYALLNCASRASRLELDLIISSFSRPSSCSGFRSVQSDLCSAVQNCGASSPAESESSSGCDSACLGGAIGGSIAALCICLVALVCVYDRRPAPKGKAAKPAAGVVMTTSATSDKAAEHA
jgi:hypothetical protein